MFCQKCGNQLAEDAAFCPKCGVKIETINHTCPVSENSAQARNDLIENKDQSDLGQNDALLKELVGKRADYYLKEFSKIERGEKSFSWCALLFGPILALYRKQFSYFAKVYLPVFALSFLIYIVNFCLYEFARPVENFGYIPLINILTMAYGIAAAIFSGMYFNKLYMKSLHKVISSNCLESVDLNTLTNNSAVKKTKPSVRIPAVVYAIYIVLIFVLQATAPSTAQLRQGSYVVMDGGTATNEEFSIGDIPSDSQQKSNGKDLLLTEQDALTIAQQFLDEHPLYLRTITGDVEYQSQTNYYISGLYRIGLIADDGSDRVMWVSKETGDIFISPDGEFLLTGEEYYETIVLNENAESYASAIQLDASLYGRWVSDNGNRIELFESGTGISNLSIWDYIPGSTIWTMGSDRDIEWQAENGRLTLAALSTTEKEYSLSNEVLSLDRSSVSYGRQEGNPGSDLYGTWMPTVGGGGGIIFNQDGTGFDNTILEPGNFTWYITDNNILVRQYIYAYHWDYSVAGNQLTLFGSNSSTYYTRVGG